MNEIRIKGRLTAVPELKMAGENKVTNFTVAVNRRFKKDVADFIECQAWGKTAEFIEKYFDKGQEILLGGELQSSQYKNKEGINVRVWRVVVEWVEFCGSSANKETSKEITNKNEKSDTGFIPIDENFIDEDLPF